MARIRSVKPSFCSSLDIARLSIPCRLHFVMLWTYADDAGRGLDDLRLLKAALWPLDDDIGLDEIESFQSELAVENRIVRYEVDGRRFFEISNFMEHQKPNRPQQTRLPGPSLSNHCSFTAHAVNGHGGRTAVVESSGGMLDNELPVDNVARLQDIKQNLSVRGGKA